jgi:RND family efflux transporter MFP subunit
MIYAAGREMHGAGRQLHQHPQPLETLASAAFVRTVCVLRNGAVADLSSDLASLKISRDVPAGPSGGKRVLFVLLVVAALGAGGWLAAQQLGARVFKAQVAITEVSMLSPVQASVQVTSTGYVVPQVQSKVGAKVPGRLAQVFVKEGDTVKAGDVLATLQDADQKSAIAAAASRVMVARARGETARANLAEVERQQKRTTALVEGNAVPRSQLEDLDSRTKSLGEMVKASSAETAAAEADVASLRVGLKDRVITAPINGTVIAKPAAIGETVGLMTGGISYVVELADFSSLVVETDVPEARLDQIKVGTPCEIVLDAYPRTRYRGVTTDIGKKINRAKATVVAKVKFKDTLDGILPDMAARVSFLNEEIKAETLQEKPKKIVAADAITERGGRKVVFAIEDGKLRIVPVQLGPSVGGSFELLEGPAAGTRVVNKPSAELIEGQGIKEQDR